MDKFLKRKAYDEINSESDTDTEEIVQKSKLRKYDVEYIQFGFIESVSNANRPQCLLCHKLLSNEAMKPAKLKRHLTTLHPEFAKKSKEFFERKREVYLKQTKTFKLSTTSTHKLLRASYLVALRVARAKKAHIIAEDLVLPCAIDMCEAVLDKKCSAKLKQIPLSDNTIARRIEDMSEDIKSQLIERVKTTSFALQLDESTDITSASQLMVYVRYCWESEMHEDFLFCHPIPTRTTGEEVFKVLDSFLFQSGLLWSRCIGLCTDGAASMTGVHSGVVAHVKKVAPDVTATHCMIHREALVTKKMDASLSEVLSSCIKVINFIKTKALYTRFFAILCDELGAEHSRLFFHTEVRWLSRGRIIQRLFELREELLMFLSDYNAELASIMADKIWLSKVAYLADIFNKFNELNLSLQGRDSNILFSHDKIEAFKKKLSIWATKVSKKILDMFPTLNEYLDNNCSVDVDLIVVDVKQHLTSVVEHFDKYFLKDFKDNIENFDWIRNPFNVEIADSMLTGNEQEELAEISCDRSLKMCFMQQRLPKFWLSLAPEYPLLSQKAVKMLLPFATTYLCEAGFSTLTNMKNKYRSRLVVEGDLRVCLSAISPRIDNLCKAKQSHPSH